jgi:hypothetical protein
MKSPVVLALCALLTLSACGKSLHLTTLKDKGGAPRVVEKSQEAILAKLSDADLAGEAVVALKKEIMNEGIMAASPTPDAGGDAAASPTPDAGAALEAWDAALAGDEAGSTLLNLGSSDSKYTKEGKEIGYVKASAMVMQAVIKLPTDKKELKKVKSMTLKLPKLRRYEATDAGVSSMSGQILCVVEGKLCTGDKSGIASETLSVKSDAFSKASALELEQAIEGKDKVFASTQMVTIDLKAALGLSDESAVEFLYANTMELKLEATESAGTPAPKSANRVLRLMIGKQTAIESGSISIELE